MLRHGAGPDARRAPTPTRSTTRRASRTTRAGTCRCRPRPARSLPGERARARPRAARATASRSARLELLRSRSPSSTRTCTARRSSTRARRWATRRPRCRRHGRRAACGGRRGSRAMRRGPGRHVLLGRDARRSRFVFDNEKWAHPVEVAPFRIARAPVTQAEFARLRRGRRLRRARAVERGGLALAATRPARPIRSTGGARVRSWLRRDFDRWVPLEPHRPVSTSTGTRPRRTAAGRGRRLPTEAEWEMAASMRRRRRKRRFPWGDARADAERANLDGARARLPADVAALPAGDSAFGCRQMIGNVWEWTASDFRPYPGLQRRTRTTSTREPWFGTHKVLRGGCWATRVAPAAQHLAQLLPARPPRRVGGLPDLRALKR